MFDCKIKRVRRVGMLRLVQDFDGSERRIIFQEGIAGKKPTVDGIGSSGHVITKYCREDDAAVAMIQNYFTYVLFAATELLRISKGIYEDGAPPTEDTDVFVQSTPLQVNFKLDVGPTRVVAEAEKES